MLKFGDLKLYATSQLDLIQTLKNQRIKQSVEFGLGKCFNLVKDHCGTDSVNMQLEDGAVLDFLKSCGTYKYLGVDQRNNYTRLVLEASTQNMEIRTFRFHS